MREPLHLVDTTMFWSPTGGGVRRYVQTKHEWLASRPGIRHTIAVPQVEGGAADSATLPSIALPASGGYRLPLDRAAIARVLVALRPDHDRYVEAARDAMDGGKTTVVVHAFSSEQANSAGEFLRAQGGEVTSTL